MEDMPISPSRTAETAKVFDGGGNNVPVLTMGGDWHLFEDITFRNTNIAIEAGMKNIIGAEGIMVKNTAGGSRFRPFLRLVRFEFRRQRDDEGRRPPELVGWYNIPPWNEDPDFEKKRLLDLITFPSVETGHVIAHNKVTGFHDALDHATLRHA